MSRSASQPATGGIGSSTVNVTGGTFTGTARALKPKKPSLHMVAVEPEKAQSIKGGVYEVHKIQGIGGGFVPENLDVSLVDEVIAVSEDDAFATSRDLARMDGIAAGISSGASVWAASQIALRPEMAGKQIVCIVPSFAERYMSTDLFEGY